jgi:hypothetical protein
MPLPVLMRRFALHQVLSFFVMFPCVMLGAPFEDSIWGLIISGVMEVLAGMFVPYSFRKTSRAACWIWVLPTALLIWLYLRFFAFWDRPNQTQILLAAYE